MSALLMIATAMAGWAFAVFLTVQSRLDERSMREQHAVELTRRDERIQQLLDQVQLNAQNMPYYPQIGPFPPVEEKRYLSSDDGLIVIEDIDDVLDEVAR